MKKIFIFALLVFASIGLQATNVEVYNATNAGINMDIKPPLLGGWARATIQPNTIKVVKGLGLVGKIHIELIGFGGAKLEIDNSNIDKGATLRVYIMKIGNKLVLTSGWPTVVKTAPIDATYIKPTSNIQKYL